MNKSVLIALGVAGVAVAAAWVLRAPAPPEAAVPEPATIELGARIVDITKSERAASKVGAAIKKTVLRGVEERDASKVAKGLRDDFRGALVQPATSVGEVSVWRGGGADVDRVTFAEGLVALFAKVSAVERTSWRVFRSFAYEGVPQVVDQKAHLSIAGVRADEHRVELQADVSVRAILTEGRWRLQSFDVEGASYTVSKLPPFRDIAEWTGLDLSRSAANQALITDAIDERAMLTNGGLTVLDFDDDGFWDVLATEVDNQTALFLNDRAGGFVRKTLPLLATPETASKLYLWLDLDGDEQPELVGTQVLTYGTTAKIGLYRVRSGDPIRMKRMSNALTFRAEPWLRRASFEAIVPCDVNADGRMDLFFAGYSHLRSERRPSLVDATDGLRNLLFINKGGLKFAEESVARGLDGTRYSLVAECRDFDGDGDADLFVGNDYGPNDYYANDGTGQFTRDASHPFHTGPSFSMGISVADYDNAGRYAVSVSNMYSHAGNRIVPITRGFSEERRAEVLRLAEGNALFEPSDDGWRDVSDAKGVRLGEWAWSNQFFDFDNDGDKDLIVANGYTSHSDPHLPDF